MKCEVEMRQAVNRVSAQLYPIPAGRSPRRTLNDLLNAYDQGDYLACPHCHMRQQQAKHMKRGDFTTCPLCQGRYQIP